MRVDMGMDMEMQMHAHVYAHAHVHALVQNAHVNGEVAAKYMCMRMCKMRMLTGKWRPSGCEALSAQWYCIEHRRTKCGARL